ncbi:hypothetical protein DVS31_02130 [Limosilactobacillus fermentum]|uniref:Uncharacterized protein n=1 Tax=Limosilactobacillus fermentum TaxID=1613 RepID=A0A2K2TJ94_LIMFE|nr:hypothetical protein [Limosilactobacillus fermentum]PNV58099.1 hypothetical protein C1Y38_04025 [Limosilactobacillus fermentum]
MTPAQSCVRLPGLLSSASFDGGNRSVGTIPCQVDTYKNENTIFLIRYCMRGIKMSYNKN